LTLQAGLNDDFLFNYLSKKCLKKLLEGECTEQPLSSCPAHWDFYCIKFTVVAVRAASAVLLLILICLIL